MPKRVDRGREEKPGTAGVGAYLGYGLTWTASTILFLLLGQWLDGQLGSEPVLTLIGAFVGAAAGFYYMYRQLLGGARGAGRNRSGGGR